MEHPLDLPLRAVADALRRRSVSALELVEEAIRRHEEQGDRLNAYKLFDAEGARRMAVRADRMLQDPDGAPPLCGVPVSVKDLYGQDGLPTFAGTVRPLPESWSRDAWLVDRLRAQGAVLVGKTHTVELAYGAVGINPHWGTPWNPWDPVTHRIPGGSSCGAGVSLWEGSALLALGTDTGGSIRIPASMTGTVGHKLTYRRWPVDGVVPLSTSLDTVGGLARSVDDSIEFFGAVDPAWGNPEELRRTGLGGGPRSLRVGVPGCGIWSDCQADVVDALHEALDGLARQGWKKADVAGDLLDEAGHLYMSGGIAGAECLGFLERDLPEWLDLLHPTVGGRLTASPSISSGAYAASVAARRRLVAASRRLFDGVDVLALPTAMVTPPPVAELEDMERYLATNAAALRPTCPVSMLALCAVTLPVGVDRCGMPIGLQLVAPGGQDELALAAALRVEQVLDTTTRRPPRSVEACR
jgi:aspartyl-tRNA(Asn)/glutamyl-tRNA(Gln) amidotransferase subunit A